MLFLKKLGFRVMTYCWAIDSIYSPFGVLLYLYGYTFLLLASLEASGVWIGTASRQY